MRSRPASRGGLSQWQHKMLSLMTGEPKGQSQIEIKSRKGGGEGCDPKAPVCNGEVTEQARCCVTYLKGGVVQTGRGSHPSSAAKGGADCRYRQSDWLAASLGPGLLLRRCEEEAQVGTD